jgi:hypothetical protein
MFSLAKVILCLAGGLAVVAGVCAAADDADNPYAPIAVRNVFDIKPPTTTNPADAKPPDPPEKITLNGIMTIFGDTQALFKVAVPGKPGTPAKDVDYILSEGQAQDEIEVMKIDAKSGVVTFNNHGVTQEIAMASPSASGGGSSAPAAAPLGAQRAFPANIPLPHSSPNGGGVTSFGGRRSGGQPAPSPQSAGAEPGLNNNSDLNNNPSVNNNMSDDEITAQVLVNHYKAVQSGDPAAAVYPPTEADADAGIPSNLDPNQEQGPRGKK